MSLLIEGRAIMCIKSCLYLLSWSENNERPTVPGDVNERLLRVLCVVEVLRLTALTFRHPTIQWGRCLPVYCSHDAAKSSNDAAKSSHDAAKSSHDTAKNLMTLPKALTTLSKALMTLSKALMTLPKAFWALRSSRDADKSYHNLFGQFLKLVYSL